MDPITDFSASAFCWSHKPSWSHFDAKTGELQIRGDSGRDYWSKTYYSPLLVKADAPALLATVPKEDEVTLEIAFTLKPVAQFDQAGVLVLVDDRTWVKAGIEYCDGVPRLGCVVTNDGFSDWSTQTLAGCSLHMRVHKLFPGPDQGPAVVVEVLGDQNLEREATGGPKDKKLKKEEWTFIRIASVRSGDKPWKMGPFVASPIEQRGGSASFHSVYLGPKVAASHQIDPGHLDVHG
mmetsp:Transcript_36878/g.102347  ORF Transcript_36878/g.102347 Transcript_36878/m.102347 type:complete len:236 (-) Transcript_36878:70-777(-)|eukprot:CAMPEP_0179017566 /NCGR_PEP_ID=MMETSP0796-20121207/3904_1 /TAXON_ID=73915 /ORGANISM="Pyrodinium bahamense, Strain pbaha01" /LENGTH=235 /DNA_ID=CAMNT_0020713297 /DNA_START=63 /DNA_END=770 /DNA_ORIENTATION=-